MPMRCAAAAWVSFRWRMVRSIRTTSPALIRYSPASARPRSANTLPVLGSCLRASLFGILHPTSQLFEPLPDQFHLRLRCRDPGLGLLLEGIVPLRQSLWAASARASAGWEDRSGPVGRNGTGPDPRPKRLGSGGAGCAPMPPAAHPPRADLILAALPDF